MRPASRGDYSRNPIPNQLTTQPSLYRRPRGLSKLTTIPVITSLCVSSASRMVASSQSLLQWMGHFDNIDRLNFRVMVLISCSHLGNITSILASFELLGVFGIQKRMFSISRTKRCVQLFKSLEQ